MLNSLIHMICRHNNGFIIGKLIYNTGKAKRTEINSLIELVDFLHLHITKQNAHKM